MQMSILYRLASKSPNYIRRFGVGAGLRLLTAIERTLPAKSSSIARYRIPGFPAPVSLRRQTSDHATFWQCIVRGQYDLSGFPQSERLMARYRAMVARGESPLIIDCGANVGLASLWLADRFPDAVVYAIEPDAANCEMLRQNTAALGARVVALQGAVWPESGEVHIVNPDSGSAAFRVGAGSAPTSGGVRAYTIDEICELAGGREPFIVKIDIEGAQGRLFGANTEWVGRTHLLALELDDWLLPWQGTSRPFFSCLSRYPFDYLIRGETIFCFRDFDASQPPGAPTA
jgi:FkbM family methyltransferase